eukprot:RCo012789
MCAWFGGLECIFMLCLHDASIFSTKAGEVCPDENAICVAFNFKRALLLTLFHCQVLCKRERKALLWQVFECCISVVDVPTTDGVDESLGYFFHVTKWYQAVRACDLSLR